MSIEEFKEDLNDYMGEGTFTVKEIDNDRIHIIWNNKGNDYSAVIESRLLEMKPSDICEEVVRPIVAKFKEIIRRSEGIPAVNISEQREKEIAEETAREFAEIKDRLKKETK